MVGGRIFLDKQETVGQVVSATSIEKNTELGKQTSGNWQRSIR